MSRYEARRAQSGASTPTPGRVLAMSGVGAAEPADRIRFAAPSTSGWDWHRIGPGHWNPDPWDEIASADVVVTHAGLGALADVAVAGRPAVVIPQERPHQEQTTTAAGSPGRDWPRSSPGRLTTRAVGDLLAAARELGGDRWHRLGRRSGWAPDGRRHHGRGVVVTTGRIAVITIAGGRHGHLRQQRLGLTRNGRRPQLHVIVPLGDPELAAVLADGPAEPQYVIAEVQGAEVQGAGIRKAHRLGLAAARNRGAEQAIDAGADVLIFLDLDCIPGSDLVERYAQSSPRRRNRLCSAARSRTCRHHHQVVTTLPPWVGRRATPPDPSRPMTR